MRGFSDQESIRRPPPPGAYTPTRQVLRLPEDVLALTLHVFAEYAPRRVEACCFWYGEQDSSGGTVRAVVIPPQLNSWGHFSIPGVAMEAVSRATRPYGWRNLTQLHSHPGVNVEHSRYDDQFVNSRQALSIVLPAYGRWSQRWPAGLGLHEYQGYWYLLTAQQASQRVVITPSSGKGVLLDVRQHR